MVTANFLQVGEIGDYGSLLGTESQVDKLGKTICLSQCYDTLELCGLVFVVAFQPLGEVVQLVKVDGLSLQTFQTGVPTVDGLDVAVRGNCITDFQLLHHVHHFIIVLSLDGERDCCLAVLGMVFVSDNGREHHMDTSKITVIISRSQETRDVSCVK